MRDRWIWEWRCHGWLWELIPTRWNTEAKAVQPRCPTCGRRPRRQWVKLPSNDG